MAEIIRRTIFVAMLAGAVAVPLPGQFNIFYNFTTANATPQGRLIQGSDGNFYGVTTQTAFKLTPAGTLTTLASSGFGGFLSTGLMQASDGNFYGVTSGSAFKLTPSGTLTTVYNFGAGATVGWVPNGPLVQGSDGNLYGTTARGGANNVGAVYQMTPAGVVTIIHSFNNSVDGADPEAGLIVAADGSLYGTTNAILNGGGTIFRITLAGTFTTVYTFPRSYATTTTLEGPTIEIMQASDGNLYGTTVAGGPAGSGTVFRMTPAGALTTLHNFNIQTDASDPLGAVVEGSDGNFYGAAAVGGVGGTGVLYEVTPCGGFTVLHSFSATSTDGAGSRNGLSKAASGVLYGTTYRGGANQVGVVFSYALPVTGGTPHPPFFACEVNLGSGVYYLVLPDGNIFGYYNYQYFPVLYHYDLGFEYFIDANDGQGGAFLYDFASGHWFYTSPSFPFPYLYDFTLGAILYYFPNTAIPGHYTTNPRVFSNLTTGMIIKM